MTPDLRYIQERLRMILASSDVDVIHHDAAMALATIEHLDGDPEARAVILNERWQGRRVRTEDHTLAPSGNTSDRLEVGNPFGGEGVVEYFYARNGKVWVVVDWGFEWVIEPTTTIIDVDEVRPPEPQARPEPEEAEPSACCGCVCHVCADAHNEGEHTNICRATTGVPDGG